MTEELYIDIHNHLYPPMDDGPSSLSESLWCIKELIGGGFRHIFFTPHLSSRKGYESVLITHLKDKNYLDRMDFSYSISAEYLFDSSMFDIVREQRIITLRENSPFFLMEVWTPFVPGLPAIEKILIAFHTHALKYGYRPILAHPERNFPLEAISDLKDTGYIIQINLGSVLGLYGREIKKRAERLIENKIADCLATDAHDIYAVKKTVEWLTRNENVSELIGLFKPSFLL